MQAKKNRGKFPGEIVVNLNACVIHLYPGSSTCVPSNPAGHAMAEIALYDGSPGGPKNQFLISFYADGVNLDPTKLDAAKNVTMFMNWGRFEAVKALIQQSESITGIYDELDGPWSDLDCVLKVGATKAKPKRLTKPRR